MSEGNVPLNDIYEYDDFRELISDWLADSKGRSQRKLAKAIGLAPSTLSQVLKEDSAAPRRLPARAFEPLCELLKLDDQESRFIVALIDHGQALDEDERARSWERVSAIRSFQFGRGLTDRQYELFSEWHNAAIMELAHCNGFRAEPEWIASTLVPPISITQARKALQLLKKLRLLVPDPVSGLRPAQGMVIDNEWGSAKARKAAMGRLHRAVLGRAAEVIDEMTSEERLLITATIAVDDDDMEKVRARVLAAVQDAFEIGTGAANARNRVIQVGLQVFPLSVKTDE
ncbi:MAG: TIGR02147 family protein [Deltaproteobacteria bacterium]|nr:TIGR02147 family protein [Deltaproteobacteria bacterium]